MTRRHTDELEQVNVNDFCRKYPQAKTLSQVTLCLGSGSHNIALERSRMHFGGHRTWFTCPCGQRVGVLYALDGSIGCVKCLNVVPTSRTQCYALKLQRKVNKLRSRLDTGDRRPLWMRHATYARIIRQLEEVEEKAFSISKRRPDDSFIA